MHVLESADHHATPGPVTTINGDVCNKTGTTITATPTGNGPNTFVYQQSITLTSPSIYVSFWNLSYYTYNINKTQSYVINTLVAFPPNEIRTQRGYHGQDGNFSLNYADLPPNQIPASAWFGQGPCWPETSACLPIQKTSYAPALAFPAMFSNLATFDPRWTGSQCKVGYAGGGIWDPPVAATQQASAEGPGSAPVAYTTTSSASSTSPAAPIAYTTSSGPVQTSSAPSIESSYTALPESTQPSSSPSVSAETPSTDAVAPSTPSSAAPSPSAPESSSSQQEASSPSSESSVHPQPGPPVSPSSQQAASAVPSPSSAPEVSTASESPASQQTTSSLSSDDVGGIIASVIGLSKTSSTAVTDSASEADLSTSSISEASPSTQPSSTDVAGALASVLAQGTTTTAVEDHTTQQPSPADPATATYASSATEYATFALGSSTLSAIVQASGNLVVAGTTYTPGQTFSVDGQTATLGTGGAVIAGTSTIEIPSPAASSNVPVQTALVTIGNSILTATQQASGLIVVGPATLSAGGSAATQGTQVLSVASPGLVLDGTSTVVISYEIVLDGTSTLTGPSQAPAAIVTAGGSAYTAVEQDPGTISLAQTTISAGGAAVTMNGQAFSAASSGLVFDGTSTLAFASQAPAAIVTAGGATVTAIQEDPGTVFIDQMTISVGGDAATIGGQTFSAASSALVINGTSTVSYTSIPTAMVDSGSAASTATGQHTTSAEASASSQSPLSTSTGPPPSSTSSLASSGACQVHYSWLAYAATAMLGLRFAIR